MARSRLEVLVRSEVARLKALAPPYEADADEVEAFKARRQDYAGRLCEALAVVAGDPSAVLKATGKVLGRLASQPPSIGVPDPSVVLRDVRGELDRDKPKAEAPRVTCAECHRQGGIRYSLAGPLHAPLDADVTPATDPRIREPLCALHAAESAFDAHVSRWHQEHPGRSDCPYSGPPTTRAFAPSQQTEAAVRRWLGRFDEALARGEAPNPMPPPRAPDTDRAREVASDMLGGRVG